jgi:molybdenum cofactor cytidylyltransferase
MFEAILLSAGQSSRMGKEKALLPMEDTTVILHVIDKLLAVADRVVVVLGDNYRSIKKYLNENYKERVDCVYNENHHEGMFSSAKKGFSVINERKHVIFQLIDQPFVPKEIYLNLANSFRGQLIYQPSVLKNGRFRAGHPILFSNNFREIIMNDSESDNLRDLINKYPMDRAFLHVENDEILDNLNTFAAYNEKLKEKLQ